MKSIKVISIYLVVLFVLSIGITAYYQLNFTSVEDHLEELDEYLVEQEFNGSILVGYQGEILFEKGYGYQDKENNIKNTKDTAFLLGSITKQFTAAAILQLQEQGKLKVTDTLDTYYSDYPNGDNITIHQLLTHTAGLPEYLNIFEKDELLGKEYSTEDVINTVKKLPPKSSPGEKFEYNNTDYFILGGIIEKVSGKSYDDYIQEHIFEPANMTHSAFGYDSSKQSNIAIGYMNDKFEEAVFVHPSFSFAGGAHSSTIYDLFLWDRALNGDKILSENSKKMMFTSYTSDALLPNESYGYGQYIIKNESIMFHPGFIDGFSSNIYRDTENELVVIALSNTDSSFIPMVPSFLSGFSERLEHSYIGYIILGTLYLALLFNIFISLKWVLAIYRGKVTLRKAKWYRIAFQSILLQLVGLALLVVPFIPRFAHDLFSSNQLLLVVAPVWGTIVNLLVLLFISASLGAIQPFIRKA